MNGEGLCDDRSEESSEYDNVNVKPLNPDKYFLSPRKVLTGILCVAWNDGLSGRKVEEFFSLNVSRCTTGGHAGSHQGRGNICVCVWWVGVGGVEEPFFLRNTFT